MKKPDIYKPLEDGRQFFTWFLEDGTVLVKIKHPTEVDGITVYTKFEKFHDSVKIDNAEFSRLLGKE